MDYLSNRFEILTEEGFKPFDGIKVSTAKNLLEIKLSTTSIKVTQKHLVKTNIGFVEAEFLSVGDLIKVRGGYEPILGLDIVSGEFEVFDALSVADTKSYITNDVVSHNCDFIGSAGTLIAPRHLKKMAFKTPIKEYENWKFYAEPILEHRYVITCDTSEGVGGDNHGIHVIDITNYPYNQVAVFKSNLTSPLMLPEMLNNVARKYNDASILIEVQSAGMMVASTLWNELEYENVLFVGQSGNKGQVLEFGTSAQRIPGIKTTKAVKKVGCSGIKDLIENGKLILNDYDTIEEFSVFVRHLDTFRAEEGYHDDLAMGMVLFGWLQHQTAFKELATRDLRDIFKERAEMFENEMLGLMSNTFGNENPEVVETIVDNSNGVVWSVFQPGLR